MENPDIVMVPIPQCNGKTAFVGPQDVARARMEAIRAARVEGAQKIGAIGRGLYDHAPVLVSAVAAGAGLIALVTALETPRRRRIKAAGKLLRELDRAFVAVGFAPFQ